MVVLSDVDIGDKFSNTHLIIDDVIFHASCLMSSNSFSEVP